LIISTSHLATAHANDYLAQLCSHFAKRVPVEETANTARVTLPIGTCDLTATETAILATVEMELEHVDRMEGFCRKVLPRGRHSLVVLDACLQV